MSKPSKTAGEAPASDSLRRRHRGWRVAAWIVGPLLLVMVPVAIVGSVTPAPSALIIRSLFVKDGAARAAEMQEHVAVEPATQMFDIAYGGGVDPVETLDLFSNATEGELLPTVVWIHGGAWVSGSSANVNPYLKLLANEGYTTVGVNYGLGPEATYPAAVNQLNEALGYLNDHADELGIDSSQIVLAGDSAGAQLASQLATLITDERYANLMGIAPALEADQLSGALLNCGVYDLASMAELDGIIAWGLQTSLWAYTGTKNWSATYEGATMSSLDFVTSDFPPTYISGGNGDGLTWLQSIPMSTALQAAGVPVTELFWPAEHEPALPHEYQFHLDRPEAQEALEATIGWLGEVTS
ncbi:alpha/beta hydrolase [Microbacterium sp. NPDC076911]|uniref:alpha/beta hydrolase n=1 Tax=Microbacterium sp. NPDC076911 TaxID=3154958 RepID=UPI003446C9A2